MSAVPPARGLLSRCASSTRTVLPAVSYQGFHTTSMRSQRRKKGKYPNVKAEDMGLAGLHRRANNNEDSGRSESYPRRYPLVSDEVFTKHKDKVAGRSEEDLKALGEKFSALQMEAIQAGEKSIDTKDLLSQGRLRMDPFRLNYIDDFSVMDPRYDVKPETEVTPTDPTVLPSSLQWAHQLGKEMEATTTKRAGDQLTRAMVRALRTVKNGKGGDLIALTDEELNAIEQNPSLVQKYLDRPDGPDPEPNEKGPEFMTQAEAQRLDEAVEEAWQAELRQISDGARDEELKETWFEEIEHGPAGTLQKDSAVARQLPKIPGVYARPDNGSKKPGTNSGGDAYAQALKVSRLPLHQLESFLTVEMSRRTVHNQTRLGKIRSSSLMMVAGNGDGMIGEGMAKSPAEMHQVSLQQATSKAIVNMKPIRRYENRTIYGSVIGKVGATTVKLSSRPPGWGIRAPPKIFELMRAVGIHDIDVRVIRGRNHMNLAKATLQALHNQPDPEAIAIGRGKKLVDVRKVYYGGSVL